MAKVYYTGPTDRNRGLFWGTLYGDELPAHIAKLLEDNPGLKAQFVPEADFAKRRPPGARVRRRVPITVSIPMQPPIKRNR